MRQIRHIVPGIYHREIKKATNYVRRTNGNKNRNSSVRTTYSSGGSSTSVPNNNGEKPIEIEDSKDDFIFTIDSSYFVNGEFKMYLQPYVANAMTDKAYIVGLNKTGFIDWGDGKVEKFVVINPYLGSEQESLRLTLKTHIYKEKGKYQIKVHHKDIPLSIGYTSYSDKENRIDISNSIISIEQWGLCSYAIPCFNVYLRQEEMNGFSHGMENLQNIPPLPYPYIETDEKEIRFGSFFIFAFAMSGIKTLPNGFLENVALSVKEHPKFTYDIGALFIEGKIETLPEDLFKPFVDFSSGEQILFAEMFANCPIKDKFPPKYQPLDWKTEKGQSAYQGIFVGCKTIPNYDEIPNVLKSGDL